MPFGLGKCVILEYIKETLGLIGVNIMGVVGWVSKRKVWRSGPKHPQGSITTGIRTMLQSRRLLMTVLPVKFFLRQDRHYLLGQQVVLSIYGYVGEKVKASSG